MNKLTLEQQRSRINNLREAEQKVKGCMRRHRIHDYIQGHVFYNLGEYPNPIRMEPTEQDYRILRECANGGAGLIHFHEDWNDALRVHGADKYNSADPEGLKRFLGVCHELGMKVTAYASMGFMQETDPDCRPEFSYPGRGPLSQSWIRYQRNTPNSPEWVDYIMPKMEQILYKYDFDGLYNDWDIIDHGETEDMLAEVYSIIKSHNKIFKLHVGRVNKLPFDTKVYDYLWTGEGVRSYELAATARNHTPYCIPCMDYRYLPNADPDFVFAQYIPFMQFPMLTYGRPVTGERSTIPGFDYVTDKNPHFHQFFLRANRYYNAHPNGPYIYSEWSAIPDNPQMPERWIHYLSLYKPMTTEGTVCHLNIGENDFLQGAIPEDVFVSIFSNEKQYMVISNLTDKPYTAVLNDTWYNRVMHARGTSVTVPPHRIVFLEK